MTKNADIDQYKYSGYGIRFDRKGQISFSSRGFGKNCIMYGGGGGGGGADTSSSSHVNNKKNIILVIGKDFVQRINGKTTIYAEKLYSINCTKTIKNFV